MLHPLLHENTSTLSEPRFSATLTGEEFFLKDHQVQGQKVLPGVAYLEMARAAVAQATEVDRDSDATVIRLQQVVWARPIVVDSYPQTVHIGLFPEEREQIAYEIYTEVPEAEANRLVHSQGVASFQVADQPASLNLGELQSRISRRSYDTQQIYDAFKALGIEYGPAHRAIEELFTGEGEVLAKVVLPSSVSATQAEFGLHPSLLDAALQAAIGLADFKQRSNELLLPYDLESISILFPCTKEMFVWLRHSQGTQPDDDIAKGAKNACRHAAASEQIGYQFMARFIFP